ncbi:hypothetical protein D3C87_1090580 [compost metagenome]
MQAYRLTDRDDPEGLASVAEAQDGPRLAPEDRRILEALLTRCELDPAVREEPGTRRQDQPGVLVIEPSGVPEGLESRVAIAADDQRRSPIVPVPVLQEPAPIDQIAKGLVGADVEEGPVDGDRTPGTPDHPRESLGAGGPLLPAGERQRHHDPRILKVEARDRERSPWGARCGPGREQPQRDGQHGGPGARLRPRFRPPPIPSPTIPPPTVSHGRLLSAFPPV